MVYKLVHYGAVIVLLVKAVSSLACINKCESLWHNISGISSGLVVVMGILWAAVFLHRNNFSKISKLGKIILLVTAVLAITATILSFKI